MEQKKDTKEPKSKKLADPVAATIDLASQQMIERAHELGIDTAFDRAVAMKPCNIGTQGICCKNCGMGPCRLPLPKGGIEGEDTRKGICGATPNTIAARNFIDVPIELFTIYLHRCVHSQPLRDIQELARIFNLIGIGFFSGRGII